MQHAAIMGIWFAVQWLYQTIEIEQQISCSNWPKSAQRSLLVRKIRTFLREVILTDVKKIRYFILAAKRLMHCGFVVQCGGIDLGQHWLR